MLKLRIRPAWAGVLLLTWCCITASMCRAQCERSWVGMGDSGGPSGAVYAAVSWDPDGSGPSEAWVVVGGFFHAVGGERVNGIAGWDGTHWHDMGLDSLDSNREVRALVVYEGDLIAVGRFHTNSENEAAAVVRWDGAEWSPFGEAGTWPGAPGLGGNGYCAAVFEGDLVVAGDVIRRWDGQAWHAMGRIFGGGQEVLAVHTHEGSVFAGGRFGVCRWDGSVWGRIADIAGLGSTVNSMASGDGSLLVGGRWDELEDLGPGSVAAWDGAAWSDATGTLLGTVAMLREIKGSIYAGGSFSINGGPGEAVNVARLAGGVWTALGSGTNDVVRCALATPQGLVFGGSFSVAGGVPVARVAVWDADQWRALGPAGLAPDAGVRALVADHGRLFAAGDFRTIGGRIAEHVAAFDGVEWKPMAGGVDGRVRALVLWNNDIVVAGDFRFADEVSAPAVARWDGQVWHAMGPLPMGAPEEVGEALCVYEGDLYVVLSRRLYRWTGTGFEVPGGGVTGVKSLTAYQGELIVAGALSIAGELSFAAAWNGASWRILGSNIQNGSSALAVFEDELYIGGNFVSIDSQPARGFAKWDGERWVPLSNGLGHNSLASVYSMFAAGDRLHALGVQINVNFAGVSVAQWDGVTWSSVASGMNSGADHAIAYAGGVFQGQIIIGGQFPGSHDTVSPNIIALACRCNADFDRDGAVNSADFFAYLAGFFGGDSGADFDLDGAVDSNDFFGFLAAFFAGCGG